VLNRFELLGATKDPRAGLARGGPNLVESETMAINVQGLQGRWNLLKGELKRRWGELSEDDLKWGDGNIDKLVGRIQQRTGETRESIEKFLEQLTSQGSSAVSSAAESVGNYANEFSHRLRDHYSNISEQACEGYLSARNVISRNPVQWMGIAFGIGVLTGLLMGGSVGGSLAHHRRYLS
jgi:uncharacterized protein YjbJ (UPF0337 family)